MTCPRCGSWIDLIPFGYGWVGVCPECKYLANEDTKKDMERFGGNEKGETI